MATPNLHDQKSLLSMMHGMWQTRCLSVVVGFKIPELVCNAKEQSLSIQDIASKTGCSSTKQIYQIMRVLAQWGIGVELENKHFAKNQAMELLRRDNGPSIGHLLKFFCSEEIWKALISFPETVRENIPAFILEHGMNNFDYMNAIEGCQYDPAKMCKCHFSQHQIGSDERRQEFVENYNPAMSIWSHLQTALPDEMEHTNLLTALPDEIEHTNLLTALPDEMEHTNLLTAFPWSTCNKLMDVGGSTGYFLASVLKQPGCEHIQGFVADLPKVIAGAKANCHDLGIPDNRITFIAQDFTDALQSDLQSLQVDTIFLKNVINMLDIDSTIKLLKNCRSLLCNEKGRCLIATSCIPEAGDTEHNIGENGIQWGFVQMHVMCLGRGLKRSKTEDIKYLTEFGGQCGFKMSEVYDTFGGGVTMFELRVDNV